MITQLKFSGTPQDQNYARKICDPNASCFEPGWNLEFEIWIKTLMKIFEKKDEDEI